MLEDQRKMEAEREQNLREERDRKLREERQKEQEEVLKMLEDQRHRENLEMKQDINENIEKVVEKVKTKFEEIRQEFKEEQKKFQEEIEKRIGTMCERQEIWAKEARQNKEECMKKIQENVDICTHLETQMQERNNAVIQEIERIDGRIHSNQQKILQIEENMKRKQNGEVTENQKKEWEKLKENLEQEIREMRRRQEEANQVEVRYITCTNTNTQIKFTGKINTLHKYKRNTDMSLTQNN